MLSYSKVLRRFKECNTTVFDELTKDGIIDIKDDAIIIRFLDQQLKDRDILSEQNRLNVQSRWNNNDRNTPVSESNTIKRREEKRRKEKKREEGVVFPFDSKEFKNIWDVWKDYKKKEFNFSNKTIQSEQASLKKLNTLAAGIEADAIAIINESMANGWKGHFKLNNNQSKDEKRIDTIRNVALRIASED